jgi:hypothetical protein
MVHVYSVQCAASREQQAASGKQCRTLPDHKNRLVLNANELLYTSLCAIQFFRLVVWPMFGRCRLVIRDDANELILRLRVGNLKGQVVDEAARAPGHDNLIALEAQFEQHSKHGTAQENGSLEYGIGVILILILARL